MDEYLKEPILTTLYHERNDRFSHHILKNSEEEHKLKANLENKLKALLTFIPAEHYQYVENEMDEILWAALEYSCFWDELFYKIGIADGMNLKKEISSVLERFNDGKNIE